MLQASGADMFDLAYRPKEPADQAPEHQSTAFLRMLLSGDAAGGCNGDRMAWSWDRVA